MAHPADFLQYPPPSSSWIDSFVYDDFPWTYYQIDPCYGLSYLSSQLYVDEGYPVQNPQEIPPLNPDTSSVSANGNLNDYSNLLKVSAPNNSRFEINTNHELIHSGMSRRVMNTVAKSVEVASAVSIMPRRTGPRHSPVLVETLSTQGTSPIVPSQREPLSLHIHRQTTTRKPNRSAPAKETQGFLSHGALPSEPEDITRLRKRVTCWMGKNPDSTLVSFEDLKFQKPEHVQEDNFVLALMKRTDGDKKFRCYACDYSVGRRDRAVDHIRAHARHKPYSCNRACKRPNCEKRFSSPKERQTHITDSTKEKPICCYCQIAQTAKNLKRHQATCAKKHPNAASVTTASSHSKPSKQRPSPY